MLRDLTVHNYRILTDFSIDGLSPVNLIVGANNSGKTSFLEALYLLVNQGNLLALKELLDDRGESARIDGAIGYPLIHMFSGHHSQADDALSAEDTIRIESRKDSFRLLEIGPGRFTGSDYVLLTSGEHSGMATEFLLVHREDAQEQGKYKQGFFRLPIDEVYRADLSRPWKRTGPHRLVTTNRPEAVYLAELWDSITLTPKEDAVLEALRILAPATERLSFTTQYTSSNGILVRMQGQPSPIPLSSMGDGMRRVLTLAMSVVAAEDGVLLVDEIDTGLYHGALRDIWRLLIETAQRLNAQIFATTHSWDCVAAFQEALSQQPGDDVGRLFRLEQWQGAIQAVRYDADDLAVAVRQAIEVR